MVQQFNFRQTAIPGLIEIVPFRADDARGSLLKDFSEEVFHTNGISHRWVEELFITSRRGVLRGLHFQRVKPVAKLIRCVSGHIWAVAADLREGSPTFKGWLSFELTGDGCGLLVPSGCAMGTLALEDSLAICRCGERFYGKYDGGVRWDDPELDVKWPLDRIGGADQLVLSDKDRQLQSLAQFIAEHRTL